MNLKAWFFDFVKYIIFRHAIWRFIVIIVFLASLSWASFILIMSDITQKPSWTTQSLKQTDSKYTFVVTTSNLVTFDINTTAKQKVKGFLAKDIELYLNDIDLELFSDKQQLQIQSYSKSLMKNFNLENFQEIARYKDGKTYYMLLGVNKTRYDYEKDSIFKKLSDFTVKNSTD